MIDPHIATRLSCMLSHWLLLISSSYLFLGNIYLFRSFVKLVLLVVDILVALLILVLFEKLKAHGIHLLVRVLTTHP